MSAAFDLLSSFGGPSKPYFGFSKLEHGYYQIELFRFVKNKMYNANNEDHVKDKLKRILLVELKDQILFLPEYFATGLNDDDAKVEELNNDGINKCLYFGGKRPHNK